MRSSPEREIVLRVSEDGSLGAAINNAQFGHSGLVNFVKSAKKRQSPKRCLFYVAE